MPSRPMQKTAGDSIATPESLTSNKPGTAAKPARRAVKRRDLICPSCSIRQPFTYICTSCGFDIKQYVIALKIKSKPPATGSNGADPQNEPKPVSAAEAASAPAKTTSPELHARAEQEIMSLFMSETPAVQEVSPTEAAPDTDHHTAVNSTFDDIAKEESQIISDDIEILLESEIAALYGAPEQEPVSEEAAEESPEERPSDKLTLSGTSSETVAIDDAFSEDIMSKLLTGLDNNDEDEAEPDVAVQSSDTDQEAAPLPESEPEAITENPQNAMPPVEDIILSASLESEALEDQDESAETPVIETALSTVPKMAATENELHSLEERMIKLLHESEDKETADTHLEDMPSAEDIVLSASLETETPTDEQDAAIITETAHPEPDVLETIESTPPESQPEEDQETVSSLKADSVIEDEEVSLASASVEEKTAGIEDKEIPLPDEPVTSPQPPKEAPPAPVQKEKSPDRPKPPVQRRPVPKPRPAPVRVRREPPAPPPPLYPERQSPGPAELLSLKDLAVSSWEQYKQRLPLLTLFSLIALAGAVIPLGVFFGLGYLAAWISPNIGLQLKTVLAMAGLPLALAGMSPGLGALVAAIVDPTASLAVAFYRGKKLWGSTTIVLLLTAGMSAGGTVLFFVPGVLAFAGGCTALFVMFTERETSLMAFIKSFEYMKGLTRDSLLKLLPVTALLIISTSLLITIPLAALPAIALLLPAVPYLGVYLYRMFENMRGVNGRIVIFQVSRHVHIRWIAASLAGAVLPFIMAFIFWQLGLY